MSGHHEVVERFREAGLPLNAALEAMLDEAAEHRTERRGSGLTQATRYLAEAINRPRAPDPTTDVALFARWREPAETTALERALRDGRLPDWRHADRFAPLACPTPEDRSLLAGEELRQATLRELPASMTREESALVAGLVRDLVLPVEEDGASGPVLEPAPEKLGVGSCPTAEKCFLELAHGFITRQGRANLIVDDTGAPLLVEKRDMGDDHSCVSLETAIINGVRVPPGSLLAVAYDDAAIEPVAAGGPLRGYRIPLAACDGFRMLRLTTLAVSPGNRARAFSSHFAAQRDAGLFEPEATELEALRAIADGRAG